VLNNKNNKITLALIVSLLAIVVSLSASQSAFASMQPSTGAMDLIKSACTVEPAQYPELARLKQEIVAANDIDQARKLALAPTDDAINALKNARNMIPFSEDLRTAENRLDNARSRIMLASSQDQVADEFDGMMLAGLDNDRAAHVNIGSGSCNYSTGELIAIAIGLILGIIPGLILLVVLC
jgi:hypothetical protein